MYDLLIPAMAFLGVVGIGSVMLVARASRQRELSARLQGRRTSPSSGFGEEQPMPLANTLEQVGRAVAPDPEQADAGLRERLTQAGYYSLSAPTIFVGAQLVLFMGSLSLAALILLTLNIPLVLRGATGVLLVAGLTLLPNMVVYGRRRQRSNEVRSQLPDAIDLLEICVTAGMGLDMAWNAVTEEFRTVSPVLADEMSLVNLQIHLGGSRADALRGMSRRTGVEDVASLVATLVQSERFGTSISQALRIYAEAMRAERSARAEERAQKLMVKMLFPMLLIFLVMFIVILGPAGIQIAAMFTRA